MTTPLRTPWLGLGLGLGLGSCLGLPQASASLPIRDWLGLRFDIVVETCERKAMIFPIEPRVLAWCGLGLGLGLGVGLGLGLGF